MFETSKTLSRLSSYASLLADQDTRDAAHHGMEQEMTQVWASFEGETSYVVPEILRIPAASLRKFQAAEPRLKPYAVYLGNITRRAAHTLGDSEEKFLVTAGLMAQAPSETFGLLTNADFPYPTVTLSDGRTGRSIRRSSRRCERCRTGATVKRSWPPSSGRSAASAGRSARR